MNNHRAPQKRTLARDVWLLTAVMVAATLALVVLVPRATEQSSRPLAIGAGLALSLAGMALTLGSLLWITRRMAEEQNRIAQALNASVVGLDRPAPQPRAMSGGRTVVVVTAVTLVLPLLVVLAFWLARPLVGRAERLVSGVVGLLPVLLTLALFLLFDVARYASTPRQAVRRLLSTGGIAAVVLLSLSAWPRIVALLRGAPLLVLALVAATFLLVLLFGDLLLLLWVFRPMGRGRYEASLARARMLRWRGDLAAFMEGTVLDYAGRHVEAEAILEELLRKGALGPQQGIALENLGYTLMRQGRYEEAARAFEGSIELGPERAGPRGGLAETLLRAGRDRARALELADEALALKRGSLAQRLVDRFRFGEMGSTRAWALAALERRAEAEAAIAWALRVADRGFKPELAGVYERIGRAWLALGERSAADESFRQAVESDPDGAYGRVAAGAMREWRGGVRRET